MAARFQGCAFESCRGRPVVGFAFDGHLIYGRYLDTSAPGFAAPLLDACGGHTHDVSSVDEHNFDLGATYHYHTQAIDATCESGEMCTTGEAYVASTTGPFQCYKADVSKSEGSSALLTMTQSSSYSAKNSMGYRCCGMTDCTRQADQTRATHAPALAARARAGVRAHAAFSDRAPPVTPRQTTR